MRISDWSSDVCSSDLPCRSEEGLYGKRQTPPPYGARYGISGLRRRNHVRGDELGFGTQSCLGDQQCWWFWRDCVRRDDAGRSEEHTSELQSLMRISYAVFCLKKKTTTMHYINQTVYHTPT